MQKLLAVALPFVIVMDTYCFACFMMILNMAMTSETVASLQSVFSEFLPCQEALGKNPKAVRV